METLQTPVAWEAHKQRHASIDRMTKRIQATGPEWRQTSDAWRTHLKPAKHSNPVPNRQCLKAGRPWQVMSIDIVYLLTATLRENTGILMLSDHFIHEMEGRPTDAQLNRWDDWKAAGWKIFCYLGVPERIYTDQGAQFESRLMAEQCAFWGVQKSQTFPPPWSWPPARSHLKISHTYLHSHSPEPESAETRERST